MMLATNPPPESLSFITTLVQYGLAGVVIAYFLVKDWKQSGETTRATRELTKATQAQVQATMIVVMALKSLDVNIGEMAKNLKEELDKDRHINENSSS